MSLSQRCPLHYRFFHSLDSMVFLDFLKNGIPETVNNGFSQKCDLFLDLIP